MPEKMSYPPVIITRVEFARVDEAIVLLEKANANLQPELLPLQEARSLMQAYARVQRLAGFGLAALAGMVGDVSEVAKATGTS
jgi:hypothetical protein